jgi:hypothetical protein
LNSISLPTRITDIVTGDVLPKSRVEASVNSTLAPFHIAITSPVLALVEFLTVYLKNADVNDPVG